MELSLNENILENDVKSLSSANKSKYASYGGTIAMIYSEDLLISTEWAEPKRMDFIFDELDLEGGVYFKLY